MKRGILRGTWPTHAISLLNPGQEPPFRITCHLELVFRDTGPGRRHAAEAPVPEDARGILSFARAIDAEGRLLVHCAGGCGRSPAAAIGILAALGATPADTVARVASMRPRMEPDACLVALMDTEIGARGRLTAALDAWSGGKPSADLGSKKR